MSLAAYQKTINLKTTSSTAYVELPATNATLTLAGDVLDDTDFTSTGMRSRILGLRDWSLSVPSNWDNSNTAFTDARSAWISRTLLDMQYLVNGTVGYGGQVYVETFSHSGDVGSLETVDISLVAAGAISTV